MVSGYDILISFHSLSSGFNGGLGLGKETFFQFQEGVFVCFFLKIFEKKEKRVVHAPEIHFMTFVKNPTFHSSVCVSELADPAEIFTD